MEDLASPSSSPPTTIKDAESLLDAIRRNSLLPSENEEMDDVNTQDLKYILVEFYLASLFSKEQPGDASRALNEDDRYQYSVSKAKRLQHAADLYETYLLRLARLMGKKNQKKINRFQLERKKLKGLSNKNC